MFFQSVDPGIQSDNVLFRGHNLRRALHFGLPRA
jgi:hypothetical protein